MTLGPVYAVLARIFLCEPDRELVTVLFAPATRTVVENIVPEFRAYAEQFGSDAQQAAAEEYAALFLLPGGVPLRAAAWLDGELETVGAGVSRRVHACLDALGRDITPGPWGRLPLDHLGLLLHLAAITATKTGGEQIAAEFVAPWAARFSAALGDRAQSPIYRLAAALLSAIAHAQTKIGP